MIADGVPVYKLSIARQLKRIKSFNFKITLNKFDPTIALRFVWLSLASPQPHRQHYASCRLSRPDLGVIFGAAFVWPERCRAGRLRLSPQPVSTDRPPRSN